MEAIFAVFERLQSGNRLPSPKGVVLRLIELAQQEDVSMAQVTRLVQSDPALAGRLVRAANSVASAPARPVVATGDAILLLGLPSVFQLALGFSLVSQHRSGECAGFDYDRYWSRSLLHAVAARAVAARARILPPEEAFVCGLLARVGCLALSTAWPQQYGAVLAATGASLEQREREAFAITHRELTGCLLAHWGLPRPLAEAVLAHESPEAAASERAGRIARILQLAGCLAELAHCDPAERAVLQARSRRCADALAFDREALDAIQDESLEAWRAWCPVFELDGQAASFGDPVAAGADAQPPAQRGGLRLIVIDSDPFASRRLAALLSDSGHEVAVARGDDVLATLVDSDVDAALVEWNPRSQAACVALRRTVAGRKVQVVALGTDRDEGALERAIAAGADDYLAKPYSPRLLEARLAAFGRMARLHRDIARDLEELRHHSCDLQSRNLRLQQAARTDEATGLARRVEGLRELQAALGRVEGPRTACLLVDIDELRPVNRRHGRLAGDRAIAHVAAVLSESAPPGASVARFGGDEFLVVLPRHDAACARGVADAITRRVAAAPLAFRGESITLTVSVGVASAGREPIPAVELAARAFGAASAARSLGGNRTCTSDQAGAHVAQSRAARRASVNKE